MPPRILSAAPAPSSAGSDLIMRGLNAKGINMQSADATAKIAGAQSGASTSAAESAKDSVANQQLDNFMKGLGDRSFNSLTEDELVKLPGATPELIKGLQEIFKRGAGKDSVEVLAKLGEQLSALKDYSDKVPKGEGWKGIPSGVWESAKNLVGEAPELKVYSDFKRGLATQVVRKVNGESGALNEGDVEGALSMLPNVPFEASEAYDMKWDLLNKLIEVQTGRKLPGLSKPKAGGLSAEEQAELQALEQKGY